MRLDEDFAPYEVLGFTVGSRYSRSEIMEAESRLLATGWYKSVTMRWVAGSEDTIQLVVLTEDAGYNKLSSFNVGSPSCLLPRSIQSDVTTMLQAKENPSKQTLSDVQEKVERWYHDQGYVCAKVTGFRISEAGALECHVDEGIVTSISVSCEDETGQPTGCYTKKEIVLDALPRAVSFLVST